MQDVDFIEGGDADVFDPEVAAQAEERNKEVVFAGDQAIQAHIRRMKQAYTAVFMTGTPEPGDVEFVMKDLFWFARGDVHFFSDPRTQDMMAGRKQVLQRISEYTRFDFETLHRMYAEAQK